jgi:hypothetical protein
LRCCKNNSDTHFLKALQGLGVDCKNNFDKIYLKTLEAPGVAAKNKLDTIFLKAIEGAGVAAQTISTQVFKGLRSWISSCKNNLGNRFFAVGLFHILHSTFS